MIGRLPLYPNKRFSVHVQLKPVKSEKRIKRGKPAQCIIYGMSLFRIKTMLVCLTLFGVLFGFSEKASGEEAVVLWTDGDVSFEMPGAESPQPVGVGGAVPEGTRVVTAENASCGLGFEGSLAESAVMIEPRSLARLENLGDSAHIGLDEGSILTKLSKLRKNSAFKVETPTAVATARGTGWKQSNERMEVFEGTVDLEASSGLKESISDGDAYEFSLDGSLALKRPADEASRQSWEQFVGHAQASPYFGRIRADDVLRIRDTIDAKRASAACGSAAAYPWDGIVEKGAAVFVAQINQLKTALTEPPFSQNPAFVSAYLDPIPDLQPGDRIRASDLNLLLDAAENASC